MNTKTNLRMNYIYNLLYQIISVVIPLITMPYISRKLGVENVGIYSFVNANCSYFILLGVFGLGTYSQLEVARRRDSQKELNQFCVQSLIARFITVGVSTVLYCIIYLANGDSEYRIYYLIQIIMLVSYGIDVSWVYQGLENFKTLTLRNLFVKVSGAILIFICINNTNDLWKYILINAATVFIGNIIVLPQVKKYFIVDHIAFGGVFQRLRDSVIYFLPSIASVLISTVDKLMIGWMTVGKQENGYYEQAYNIEYAIFLIFVALNYTMRPRMAYLYKNKQLEEMRELLNYSITITLILVIPIAVGLYLISDIFVPWYFGDGFEKVSTLLQIMSGWIVAKALSNCLLDQAIVPQNGQVFATKAIWFTVIVNISFNLLLIPKYYSVGAAVASVLSEITMAVIAMVKARKDIYVRELLEHIWKVLVASIAMAIILLGLKKHVGATMQGVIMMVGVGGLSYGFALTVLRERVLLNEMKKVKERLKLRW